MVSIDKRQDGHYRARWREYPGGPQKTKQFSRKKEAEIFVKGSAHTPSSSSHLGVLRSAPHSTT